jgi:hypothetical protein
MAPTVVAETPSSLPAPTVQQPTKPQTMTPPALAAVPALPAPVIDTPLPAVMNELPPNSLRPSDLGRPAPLSFNGNILTSINPNQEARPVVAPAVNIAEPSSRRVDEPPGNAKLNEVLDLLVSSSKTAMSEPNLLKRKYDIMGVKAIQDALSGITPMTSYGQFGATQTQAETTKRGQDITARGQDLNAQAANVMAALKADENSMNALYRSGLLKQGQEELEVKKVLADPKNPQNYIKIVQAFSPKIKTINTETGAEQEELDERAGMVKAKQLFNMDPPPSMKGGGTGIEKQTPNPDGTMTITYTDGTTRKFRRKEK